MDKEILMLEALKGEAQMRDHWCRIASECFKKIEALEEERDILREHTRGYLREIDRLLGVAKELERRLDSSRH